MQPDRSRPVYDSDITMKPVLRAIAIQYVAEYHGNFDMMIGAKQYLADTGTLTDSMLRPVLNTLRRENRPEYDTLARTLRASLGEPLDRPVVDLDAKVIPIRREVKERERPARITFGPKSLRAKYATTRQRAQKPVYHLLHSTCDVEWSFPRNKRGQLMKHLPREFTIKVSRFCGGYPSPGVRFWDHIPTDEEAWPGNKNNHGQVLGLCTACRAAQERYGHD